MYAGENKKDLSDEKYIVLQFSFPSKAQYKYIYVFGVSGLAEEFNEAPYN